MDARFTLEMRIKDNQSFDPPVSMTIGINEAMQISERAVDEMKLGAAIGSPLMGKNDVIRLLKTKELRRDVLKQLAVQLAGQLADRLEDAEGWHDPSRIEPARKALGGKWA